MARRTIQPSQEALSSCHAGLEPFLRGKKLSVLGLGYAEMGQSNFDSVANFYLLLEQLVFGSTLNRARGFFAGEIAAGKEILLIGEGNGRFLCEMMKQTSSASFTVVDSSARMLAAAGRRTAPLTSKRRIEWICADFLRWPAPGALYDRVVTHFFLDLFRPDRICQIVEKISRITTEDGLWVNVDFTPEGRFLHQRMLMWAQYRFSRIGRNRGVPAL